MFKQQQTPYVTAFLKKTTKHIHFHYKAPIKGKINNRLLPNYVIKQETSHTKVRINYSKSFKGSMYNNTAIQETVSNNKYGRYSLFHVEFNNKDLLNSFV